MAGTSGAQPGAGHVAAGSAGDVPDVQATNVSDAELLVLGRQVLQGQDLNLMSLQAFRSQLAVCAGLGDGGLEDRAQDVGSCYTLGRGALVRKARLVDD